jgi:hypothetical protein
MSVPIGTPAHAPHIQPIDVSKVLGQSPVYELPIRENVHVISTSTCQPFEGLTLGDVLNEALRDITCRMLNLAGVIDYIISELQDTEIVNLEGSRERRRQLHNTVCAIRREKWPS